MDALAKLQARIDIEELNAAFVHALDHGQIDALVALFTPDAIYTHGDRRSEGQREIRELFERRANAGVRTSRHLYSALHVVFDGPDRARGRSVCVTYAADAAPPVTPAETHLVADFDDVYARDRSGQWRLAERRITRIFVAPGNRGPVGTAHAGRSP